MNFFLKLSVVCVCLTHLINPAQAQSRLPTSAEIQEILDAHNLARSETANEEGVGNMPELVWNSNNANIGQQYFAANNCPFAHNPNREGTGENLAWGYRSWHAAIYDGWYASEKAAYLSGSRVLSAIGHYTQVTWDDTTSVGCAICNEDTYVCNYSPPGNFNGLTAWQGGSSPCSSCPSSHPSCTTGELSGLCTNGTVATTQATTTQTQATTTTQPAQTTQATTQQTQVTTTQQPVQTTTTQPAATNPPSDPDMVLQFTLRYPYSQITDFAAFEEDIKGQLEAIFGFPRDRTSIEFAPHSNPSFTTLIVTVAGAASADQPTAASMAEALTNSDGLDSLNAADVECVSNCGTMGEPANLATTSATSTGLIIGVVVGAIVVVLAIAIGAFFFLKKRKEKNYLDNMAGNSQMSASGQVNSSGAFA